MLLPRPDTRALSPTVGTVLLVGFTVVLAGVTVATVDAGPPEQHPTAVLTAHADADTDRITVVHRGGDPLDPNSLTIRLSVAGEPVAHQPPVPFFAARGFASGPTSAFNDATSDPWTAGEHASIRLAETNTAVEAGDQVVVRISYGDRPLAVLRVQAR